MARSERMATESDPYYKVAIELALRYEDDGVRLDDPIAFLKYMRGLVDPEQLDEDTREYFEKVTQHIHIDGLLDGLDRELHIEGVDRPRRDNRTALTANHVREVLAPIMAETLDELRTGYPHGFHYEVHEDSRELAIAEAFCLGVVLAAVDIRRQVIEGLYGGPSSLQPEA